MPSSSSSSSSLLLLLNKKNRKLLFGGGLLLYLFSLIYDYLKYGKYTEPPQIPNNLPFGIDRFVQRLRRMTNPMELWDHWRLKYAGEKGVFQLNTLGRRVYFFFHPEAVKHMLSTGWKNYEKGERATKAFAPLLGDGIFNTNGDLWQHHRQLARPHFEKMELNGMIPPFHHHAMTLKQTLQQHSSSSSSSIDVQNLMFEFTLSSVGEVLMATDVSKSASGFAQLFDFVQYRSVVRLMFYPYILLFPDSKFTNSINALNDFTKSIVDQAMTDPKLQDRTDLLAEYIKDESAQESTTEKKEVYLQNMLKNMLIAGRDTTACLLTWTLYELAQHPDVENEILQEMFTVFGDSLYDCAVPTNEQLSELKYTKKVLNEVLRLHPSVPFNVRFSMNDEVEPFSGYLIRGGVPVIYSAYVTGRAKEFWGNDAEKFDPSRWDSDRIKSIHPFAFVAFHAGPRICLGQNMAIIEAKTCLLSILPYFKFKLDPTCKVEPKAAIVLQCKNGMKLFVEKREKI